MRLRSLFALLILVSALPLRAAETFFRLDTRPNVTVPVFYIKNDQAVATVLLLPGGSGKMGKLVGGKPSGQNFLVRSRDEFASAGFNVAIIGPPSDNLDLEGMARVSPEHVADVRALVDFLKKDTGLPIWLVGTSRGTISATAAAIAFGNESLAGVVLTSSIVSRKDPASVLAQDLGKIHVPVLVLHHEKDECRWCAPYEVSKVIDGLKNASPRKLIMVNGGNPAGDPCEALHYHGYNGIEKSTVEAITTWMKSPSM
jgi:pimeloyl-ACP methyl ester carboxylesterase